MYVVSIDPGIVSIGLVHVEINPEYELVRVLSCSAVNMTRLRTATGNHIHDMIVAFMREYDAMFVEAQCILLERQPFQSAGMPLELLFRERFGCKCVFLSPHTIHKQFGLQGYEYEGRKQKAVALISAEISHWCTREIPGAAEAMEALGKLNRKHDICDAMMIFIAWIRPLHNKPKPKSNAMDFSTFVESCRYTKKKVK